MISDVRKKDDCSRMMTADSIRQENSKEKY